MFVGRDHNIEPLRNGGNIGDDLRDEVGASRDGTVDPAVDQHPEIAAVGFGEFQQVRVADALTVMPHRHPCFSLQQRA